MQLRDYQQDLLARVYQEYRKGHQRVMAQLPTGGGKTALFSKVCQDGHANDRKVLVLAHREELVKQAANHISKAIGAEVGIIKSGIEPDYSRSIQVASVQSIVNRFDLCESFDLIITDEVHHAIASQYQQIYNQYPTAKQLGVTATPIRLNGKGFADIFDSMVCGPTCQQLIDLGHLSKFKLFAAPQMKFENVGKTAGEYSQSDITAQNDPAELAGDIVSSYRRYADGTQCLVFATSVQHSIAIAQAYNADGIKAIHLDGTTPSAIREQALLDFAAKQIQVVSNCALFGEGLDIPALETVQIARRTASVSLHLQMLGRVLRVAEGKPHAIIIDHTDNWQRLGLPTKPRNWSLVGAKDGAEKLERDDDGEVKEVKKANEPVDSIPSHIDLLLEEIKTPTTEAEMWEYEFQQLVIIMHQKGYKRGWLTYKVGEMRPPLAVWKMLGKQHSYHWKWADHQYRIQLNNQLELV